MSSSPDPFQSYFDSHEPKQELDSPFLNEALFVDEETETASDWETRLNRFQLESPFLEAFEEGWGAIDEAEEFEGFLNDVYEEEFEEENFADFTADYEQELEAEEFLGNLEEEEVPPAWLKLFVHFLPGLTKPIPLELSKLNPGYIDSNDELILSNLQSKLKNLLETKYKSGNKIRVALVDLTGPTKLKNPEYAGFRSTVETYGASCSKVAALYVAHQLRFDLITQARANPGLTQRQIFEAWANLGISDRERERPNLKQIFNISNGLDDSIPKTIDFSPRFQKTLETVAIFGDPNYNKSASIVIDLLGFPYIASVLWQSGLYHPKRGGLWLGADYGGHTWKRDPIGGQSQGVNALSLATFYTLLAQERLIDADASQNIKKILSQTKVSAANKGTFEKILRAKGMLKTSDKIYSKFGVWDKWFHDGALIERTIESGETLHYVAVILTESYDRSRRYGVLRDLLVDLDKLIQTNNSVTEAQELWSTEYESNNLFFSGYGDREFGEVDNWGELFANEEDESEADVFDEFVDELDEEEFEEEEDSRGDDKFPLTEWKLGTGKIVVARAGDKKKGTAVTITEAPAVFLPEIIGLARDEAIKNKKNVLIDKLDPATWFKKFTRITFLGRSLKQGQYLHLEMAKLLKAIEAEMVKKYGGNAKSIGDMLLNKSTEGISGSRLVSPTATFSMHMFGLAIDVNYLGNPYIESQDDIKVLNTVLKNAALLMNRPTLSHKQGYEKNKFDSVQQLDAMLEKYFSLLDSSAELEQLVKASSSSEWRGLSVADAKTKIQKNLDNLAGYLARDKHKDYFKKHAILDFDKRFVVQMEELGLNWGGHYGDMMHFDMRTIGVGIYIEKARLAYAKKVKKLAQHLFKEKNYGIHPPA